MDRLLLPILVLLLILALACRFFLGDPVPARGQVKMNQQS
jgi:hypothetical protein